MTKSSNCSVTTLQLDSETGRISSCIVVCSLLSIRITLIQILFHISHREKLCPQGYTGLVRREVNKPGSDQEVNNKHCAVKVSSVFHNVTYWNLETPPNSDDGIVMAMAWPDLTEVIHVPVDD
uniref:Uncharacterized protein n=1 Tax=Salmo trutta TaxID=8032 RepID=A0A674D9K8_SALTR